MPTLAGSSVGGQAGSGFRNVAPVSLQRGDQLVGSLDRALAGIVAPDEPRKLAAEIWMHAEIVERAEIPLLDRLAFFGQQRIAIEHRAFIVLELLADLGIPLHVLNEVMSGEIRIESFPGH